MVIVTHESYDSVLVGTGKQKGLESLSENREWRRRCDAHGEAPDGGTTTGNFYQLGLNILCVSSFVTSITLRDPWRCSWRQRSLLSKPRNLRCGPFVVKRSPVNRCTYLNAVLGKFQIRIPAGHQLSLLRVEQRQREAVLTTVHLQLFHCGRRVAGLRLKTHVSNRNITAGTLVPSSVNGDIAIQREWSNFDPSQNPNP